MKPVLGKGLGPGLGQAGPSAHGASLGCSVLVVSFLSLCDLGVWCSWII